MDASDDLVTFCIPKLFSGYITPSTHTDITLYSEFLKKECDSIGESVNCHISLYSPIQPKGNDFVISIHGQNTIEAKNKLFSERIPWVFSY